MVTQEDGKYIENLIHNGTYTVGSENGQFSRMPGYSFYRFLLFIFKNWITSIFIGWFQTFLDIFCIYIFYNLTLLIFNKRTALIAALLYATYPYNSMESS